MFLLSQHLVGKLVGRGQAQNGSSQGQEGRGRGETGRGRGGQRGRDQAQDGSRVGKARLAASVAAAVVVAKENKSTLTRLPRKDARKETSPKKKPAPINKQFADFEEVCIGAALVDQDRSSSAADPLNQIR